MASFVFVRAIEKRNSAFAWKNTAYKRRSAWLKASGAVEATYRLGRTRGVVGIPCLRLPNGRCVQAEVRTEASIEEARAREKACRTLARHLVSKSATPRSKERAFLEYLKQGNTRSKASVKGRSDRKRISG